MNQILTQDEVEALLKAVGADEFVPDDGDGHDGETESAQGQIYGFAARRRRLVHRRTRHGTSLETASARFESPRRGGASQRTGIDQQSG